MTTITEIWRTHPKCPGYLFSNLGNIKERHYLDKWIPYKVKINKEYPDRYPQLCNIKLHKIFAEIFIGKRPKGLVIMHLDGNKHNNAATNLKYGTTSENAREQALRRHICGLRNIAR